MALDVDLVWLVATDREAAPLRGSLCSVEHRDAAGAEWWLGTLRSGIRDVPTALVVGGYEKVNAAHALTLVLSTVCPSLVLNVGVAGAYPGSGLAVGDLVLATDEVYADTGVLAPEGWLSTEAIGLPLARTGGREYGNSFPLDADLVRAAVRAVEAAPWPPPRPRIAAGLCLTSSVVTGRTVDAEVLETRWHALAESMEGAAAAHVCLLHGVPFLEVRGISNRVADRDRAAWDLDAAAARAAAAALAICARLDEVLASMSRAADGLGA